MPPLNTTAIEEINTVLQAYLELVRKYQKPNNGSGYYFSSPEKDAARMITQMRATIRRLAPPDYESDILQLNVPNAPPLPSETINTLAGVLESLAEDYRNGHLQSFAERVHSDIFSDFLEMADYLLEDEGLKDPAAVLIGGVLEQHLRTLCDKHSIPIPPKPKLDKLNADLGARRFTGKTNTNK